MLSDVEILARLLALRECVPMIHNKLTLTRLYSQMIPCLHTLDARQVASSSQNLHHHRPEGGKLWTVVARRLGTN